MVGLNRTIQNIPSKYVSVIRHNKWDKTLPQCTFAYNSTSSAKHSATHKSPSEVIFGRVADMLYDFPNEYNFINWSNHLEKLKQIQDIVKQTMKVKQEKYRKRENLKRKQHVYEVGDTVVLLDPVGPSGISKNCIVYIGKCKNMKRHIDLVYTVLSLATRKSHKVNI